MFGTGSSFTNSATGVVQGDVYFNAANASMDNAGAINGEVTFGAGADTMVNSGAINGSVSLLGGYIDSTLGSIDDSISIGSDGGYVIAGRTGGSVFGGSGFGGGGTAAHWGAAILISRWFEAPFGVATFTSSNGSPLPLGAGVAEHGDRVPAGRVGEEGAVRQAAVQSGQ